MIVIRVIFAIGAIVFGFVVYPYYVDYVLTPISAIAIALNPDLNILETTYLSVLPFVVLVMILYFGVMAMLGKVGIGKKEGD